MQKEEQKELFRELSEIKDDITSLKTTLNQTDEKKEEWFNKKEEFSIKIRDLIRRIREDKEKRNSLTKEVKEGKTQRDVLNREAKNKISKLKDLRDEKAKISKKFNIQGDPSGIKAQIEKLEFQIETEGVSFEKEKRIMKVINELKKKYKEAEKISTVWGEIHQRSKDIDSKKKEAEEAHRKIQKTAQKSQEKHEDMISSSKEVDELKKQEEEAFKKFVEFKTKFNNANEKLKEKLIELNKIKIQIDKGKKEVRLNRANTEHEILKIKGQDVEEKIKKKKKLTTEDLLVFQSKK